MSQLKQVTKFSKKGNNSNEKIKIEIDETTLDDFLYFIPDVRNKYRTKKFLRNLKKLLEISDMSVYAESPELNLKINVILQLIECYLNKEMTTTSVIINEIKTILPETKKLYKDYFMDLEEFSTDNSGETFIELDVGKYLCRYVEDRLNYCNMFKAKELLMPLFKKLESEEENLTSLNKIYSDAIERVYSDNIKCRTREEYSLDDFSSTDEDNVDTILDKTIKEYQNPNNRISTGIKCFNDLLGGGFENGRFYLACGLPKAFKSGTLLNFIIWGMKYNKYELENGLKPTIFYLTQENSTKETINRIYVNLTGKSIANYTLKEAKKILQDEVFNKYGICLEIKYRPNKSINTLDFDNFISDIETEGKKVVLAVQDYTKRIRSSNPDKELRLELANVADDFCSIAKRRNIPIISAAQLNREAMREAEKLMNKKSTDIAKMLSTSHIGESAGLIENADCSFVIYREKIEETGEQYLGVKLLVSREEEPKITYFAQRFENGMKLEEDIDLDKSLSLTSISKAVTDNFSPNKARKKLSKKTRGKIEYMDSEDDDIDFDEDGITSDEDIEEETIKEKPRRPVSNKSKSTTKKKTSTKKKKTTSNKKGVTKAIIAKEDEELLLEDNDDDINFGDE